MNSLKGPIVLLKEVGLPCGTIVGTEFLRVLLFAIFPTIRKNKFPQIKIITNIFPAKIYSIVNIP